MSKPNQSKEHSPRGPEGVPVDAPDNDAPAISPHAVSRMHRSEDDGEAFAHSPDYSDTRSIPHDLRTMPQQQVPSAPGSGPRDDVSNGLDGTDTTPRTPNPSHNTRKSDQEPPRGGGDSELMDQPANTHDARQPGADDPALDE